MKNRLIPFLLLAIFIASCNSSATKIFLKKTPLEKYEDKLEDSGLEKTPGGRQWLAASKQALQQPHLIQLPYRQLGTFPADIPRALGLQFTARRGERLLFDLQKNTAANFVLYAELYKTSGSGDPQLVQAIDTNISDFSFDVAEEGVYILKIQPQLFRVGSYTLAVSTGPSLYFPVAGTKATIGSLWGADRDGGKRSHEGIDIFAPKRTPAIAAADGFIVGVREGGIGGKTVWLRPGKQAYTLYYAHLDEQLVTEGQAVKKGDTIGLVGNTGNAQTTPPHLHFGVYAQGGAVDPYPFVARQVKTAPPLSEKKLLATIRLLKEYKLADGAVKQGSVATPLALTAKGYIAQLPDGRMIQPPLSLVQPASQPLKNTKAIAATTIYNTPAPEGVSKGGLQVGNTVAVLGYHNEYALVRWGETEGWVLKSSLKG